MTREEAIQVLKDTYAHWLRLKEEHLLPCSECEDTMEAIDMAISALNEAENGCDGCLYEVSDGSLFPCNICRLNYGCKYEKDDSKRAEPSEKQVTSKLQNPCDSLLTDDSAECKEQKSKLDLISRADAIDAVTKTQGLRADAFKALVALPSAEAVHKPDYSYEADMVRRLREYEHGWIPFTRRPMTEEEQEDYPDCTFIFDCVLPDDGDEILVSNGRFVWMDTFCDDDRCYLDGGDDIDEDMAWMPLPKPYKGGDSE